MTYLYEYSIINTVEKGKNLNNKGGKDMIETMGMTDLQFKSWLKQIIRSLESAKESVTKEETDKKLNELLQDLKEDLQG